jgi:uncharacterized membrane protein
MPANASHTSGPPKNRAQAQERADRIRAFQEELDQLEREQVLVIPENQRRQLVRHHQKILADLAKLFDVDTSATQKQMSLGMRIASFLGAVALAASAFFFFYRFWGLISTPVQVLILVCAPILAILGVEIIGKREKYPYFTSLIGLVAFACFVLNLSVLGSIFNITPSQNAFLAWAVLAMILAYGYGLRLLLVAGILCLLFFLSASVGEWSGIYWLSFGLRPENFLPAGILLFFLPKFIAHSKYPDFPGYYRVFGMLTVLIAILILSHWGEGSYLMLPAEDVKVLYQLLGFTVSGLTIWTGIRWHWQGVTNLGSTFFVIQLYTKFYDWWWDWMPKYLFFLVIGLVAILLLNIFKRLRLHLVQASA